MKTFVIIFLTLLFLTTLVCYFAQCKEDKCTKKSKDKRAEGIKRAQKNLFHLLHIQSQVLMQLHFVVLNYFQI